MKIIKYLYFVFLILFTSCNPKINSDLRKNQVKFMYDEHIFFNAKINDYTNCKVIYDTAIPGLCLDSAFVSKHFIYKKSRVTTFTGGVGIQNNTTNVIQDTIKCAVNIYKNIYDSTPIFDLKKIGGQNVDGIIGASIFKGKVTRFDLINQNLEIFDNANQIENLKSYESLDFDFDKNQIILNLPFQITANMKVNGKFLVDTGSSFALTLTSQFAKKMNLKELDNKLEYNSINLGIGGKSSGFIIKTDYMQIGNITLLNIPTIFSNDKYGALSFNHYDGIIGTKILEKFSIIIDPIYEKLYFKRSTNNLKFEYPTLGFTFINRNDINKGWIIKTLINNSNAHKIGIKIGDQIIKVDNNNVENINEKKFMNKIKIQKKIKLKILRNNNIISFIMKLKKNNEIDKLFR